MKRIFIFLLGLCLIVFIFGTDNIAYDYQEEYFNHGHEHDNYDEYISYFEDKDDCGCCHEDFDIDTKCNDCYLNCSGLECNCENKSFSDKGLVVDSVELSSLLNVEDKRLLSREQLIKLENYYHSLSEEELTQLYIDNQAKGSTTPTNRGYWDNQDIVTYSEKKVNNSYYFENFYIDYSNPYNKDETCGYVASASLLGWHDTFSSNNFIPDTLSYGSFSNIDTTLELEMTNNINPKYHVGSKDSTTGPTVQFHDYLYELGQDNGKEHWITQIGMADVMRYHISQQTNLGSSVTVDNTWLIFQTKKVETYIDSGIPVTGMFLTYEYAYENPDGSIGMIYTQTNMAAAHSVVIYGYKETSDGVWYYAHSGWQGSSEGRMLIRRISGSSNQDFAWIQYNGSHVCSDNYKVKHGSCVVDICAKCIPTQFTLDESTVNYDYYTHNGCSDNTRVAVTHKYNTVVGTTATQHTKKCDNCTRTITENHQALNGGNQVPSYIRQAINSYSHTTIYSCCGYVSVFDSPHNYSTEFDENKHWQECYVCKYSKDEVNHNYVIYGSFDAHMLSCRYCMYEKKCTSAPTLVSKSGSTHTLSCHGYQVTRTHELTQSDGTFDEHYAKCTTISCDYVSPTICTDAPLIINSTTTQHRLSCHGKVKWENHIFTAGSGTILNHYPKCSVTGCDYTKTTKCTETVPIVSYNSSTHTYRCHGISYSEPHDKYIIGGVQYCSVEGCNWSQSAHTHNYGAPYIPAGNSGGMSRHYATCSCGDKILRPCMGFAPEPGQNAICALCGQEMIGGMVIMKLPNGLEIVLHDKDYLLYLNEN